MIDDEKELAIAKVVKLLQEHGIEMLVGGCGCCGSPWVKVRYNGEWILPLSDNADFSSFPYSAEAPE